MISQVQVKTGPQKLQCINTTRGGYGAACPVANHHWLKSFRFLLILFSNASLFCLRLSISAKVLELNISFSSLSFSRDLAFSIASFRSFLSLIRASLSLILVLFEFIPFQTCLILPWFYGVLLIHCLAHRVY